MEPLLRPKDVCALLRISQPTLYRWIREKILPSPIKYGPMLTGWERDTIDDWLRQKSLNNDQVALKKS
jgi:prophage regulatory protein